MAQLVEALIKFISEFTLRRLAAVIVMLLIAAIAFFAYERYTSSFRFSRLQKAADLMVRLQELSARGTNFGPDLERARRTLVEQTIQAIQEKPLTLDIVPSRLHLSLDHLWKFLVGSALWGTVALFIAFKARVKDKKQQVSGLFMISFLSGLSAMFVPPVAWPWFHLFGLPVIEIVAISIPVAVVVGTHSARQKTRQVVCTNNLKQIGLAAKMWALAHNNTLPSDLSVLKRELGDGAVSSCPLGGMRPYEILAPGTTEMDGSIIYAWCPTHKSILRVNGVVENVGSRSVVKRNGKWIVE